MAAIATTVEVYCQEWSHAEKRWEIASFKQIRPGRWVMSPGRFGSGKRLRQPGDTRARIDRATDTRIDTEEHRVKDAAGETRLRKTDETRNRYNLRCAKCDLSVPCRSETLDSILATLAAAGVSEISLAALAARVRRSVK